MQPRQVVRQIGAADLRTQLVTDQEVLDRRMSNFQTGVGQHLAELHARWVLRRMGINCVLDVGANNGQFARSLRQGGYRGRIVSFEPVPRSLRMLRERAAGDPEWQIRPCALGRHRGRTTINVSHGRVSSLLPGSEFGRQWSENLRTTRPVEIRVRRLDDLFDDVVSGLDEPRVMLKMDTQGFDLEVFAGAGESIADVIALQSEVSFVPLYEGMPRMPEQLTTYEAAGFEVSGIYPVTRHTATMRLIEADLIMVRPEAVPRRAAYEEPGRRTPDPQ